MVRVIADFNGDGKPDFAATHDAAGSGNASIKLKNGSGGFLPTISIPIGKVVEGIEAGDIDADGDIDLAIAKAVTLLRNNGAGSFAVLAPQVYLDHIVRACHSDLDGDQRADIVAFHYNSAMGVAISTSTAIWTPCSAPSSACSARAALH